MDNTTEDTNITCLNATETPTSIGLTGEQISFLWHLYRVVVPVVFSIISFVGTLGNVLVLIVCAKNKTMKTLNNSLVSLLAVADLVFLLLCVPTTVIVYSVTNWPFGVLMCKALHYLIYVSIYITIHVMCLMSFERFCAIVFPLKGRGIGSRKSLMYLSLGIVIFALGANIPALFMYNIQHLTDIYNDKSEFCFHDHYMLFTDHFSLSHLFFMSFGIFVYVIPIFTIIFTYSAIFYKLVNRKKVSSTNTSVAHIRAAKIILVLEVGFFICYTPIQIMFILEKFTDFFNSFNTDYVTGYVVFVVGNVLSYTNSCLNPILYTFVSSEYRATFVLLLKRKK